MGLKIPESASEKWQGIVDTLSEIVDAQAALITGIVENDLQILVASSSEINLGHPKVNATILRRCCEIVLRDDQELLVPDLLKNGRLIPQPTAESSVRAFLGVPVLGPNHYPFGVLCVLDRRENWFSNLGRRLLAQSRDAMETHLKLRDSDNQVETIREYLDLVVCGSKDGFWHWDMQSGEVYWSDRLKEILGYAPDDFQPSYERFLGLIHDEDRDRVVQTQEAQQERRQPYKVQYRLRRADGSYLWIESTGQFLRDVDGTAIRLAGAVTDITKRVEAERRLLLLNERLEFAIRAGRIGIFEADLVSGGCSCNQEMNEIYGLGPGSFRDAVPSNPFGGNVPEWFRVVHPEDRPHVLEALARAQEGTSTVEYEHRILRPSGEVRHLRSAAQVLRDASGMPIRGIGTTLDITEFRRLNDALSEEKERLILATQLGGIGIWELDRRNRQIIWDEQMHSLYGLKPGEFGGRLDDWLALIHPDDVARLEEEWTSSLANSTLFESEFRITHPSGELRYIRAFAQVFPLSDGSFVRVLGTNHDVTAERKAELELIASHERLRREATRDGLTGLWNRVSIMDLLRREVRRSGREQRPVGVLLVDLDQFKRINDTRGHQAGDAVLREAAVRLVNATRPYDMIGRYGGEEFLIVLPDGDGTRSHRFAERLRDRLASEPVAYENGFIDVTMSIGVTVYPGHGATDADALVRSADIALYRAKREGRNRVVVSADVAPAHASIDD